MAILKVAQMGHPILRQKTKDVSVEEIRSSTMQALVQDMYETMLEYGGVGLAAPQVHQSLRLAVVEFDPEQERYETEQAQEFSVFFNARITVIDETPFGMWEGCLSVQGLRGYVERPRHIRVDYLDRDGQAKQLKAQDFLAVVLQHELDHLDGALYVDRMKDMSKLAFIEEYGRYHREDSA